MDAADRTFDLLDRRKDAALRKAGYQSWDYWQNRGRVVVKGQKAKEFNSKGTPLFTKAQTTEKDFYCGEEWPEEFSYEDFRND